MQVTLWRSRATMVRPIAAAEQYHHERPRLYVRIDDAGVHGFGEIAPQPQTLNGDPSVEEVETELTRFTLPQLLNVRQRELELPSWSRVNRFAGSRRASAPAVALVEMALLDRELRRNQRTLLALWPARYATPEQVTVSVLNLENPWHIPAGAARVRVKTAPGRLGGPALERLRALECPILLDFNCSAADAMEVVEQVEQVRLVASLALVEQPFAAGNVADHAALARRLDVSLSLDEGVRSARDLEQIARYRAATTVCIKPARVGGVAVARTMVGRAKELGLAPYLGGFFESPLARFVHRTLAQHCVSEPSDVAEVEDEVDGRGVTTVSGGFGLAPSEELLSRARVIAPLG